MLTTQRLLLRPPVEDDLDALCTVFGDREVMRFIGDGAPRTREQVQLGLRKTIDEIASTGLGCFTVVRTDTQEICGDCVLVKIPPSGVDWRNSGVRGPEVEVGYRLAKAHWGQGFATEAASRMLDYAFDEMRLDDVVAVTKSENLASMRVLTKIGMTHHGITDRFYDLPCEFFSRRNER